MNASCGIVGRSTSRVRNSARSPGAIGWSPPGMSSKASIATAWTPSTRSGRRPAWSAGARRAGRSPAVARPASSRRRSSSARTRGTRGGAGSRCRRAGPPRPGCGARSCRRRGHDRRRPSSSAVPMPCRRASARTWIVAQNPSNSGGQHVDPADPGGPDRAAVGLDEEPRRPGVGARRPAHLVDRGRVVRVGLVDDGGDRRQVRVAQVRFPEPERHPRVVIGAEVRRHPVARS